MNYIEKSLSKDEQVAEIFKLHWISKVPLVSYVLLSFLTFGLSLLMFLYEWLRLQNLEQGLTNKRVIRKTGIISRDTAEMQLRAIERIEMEQGVLGRIFNYGNLIVAGQGAGKVIINTIADPLNAKRRIESLIAS